MKRIIFGAILTCGLLAPSSDAQRGAAGGRGPAALSAPGAPNPRSGRYGVNGQAGFGRRGLGSGGAAPGPVWGSSFWGYPGYYSGYDWPPDLSERSEDQAVSPPVFVVMPQMVAPEAPPPPPPEPARPVLREYMWPDSGGGAGAPFSIVSKDGTVRFAIAVWVQAGVLYFAGPDRTRGEMSLASVNREATTQLNAEKRLRLQLPGR